MMTKQQKHMLEQALEVLNSMFNKKSDLIDHTAYATAKIEDVLAMDEAEERPMTAEDILGIGGKE